MNDRLSSSFHSNPPVAMTTPPRARASNRVPSGRSKTTPTTPPSSVTNDRALHSVIGSTPTSRHALSSDPANACPAPRSSCTARRSSSSTETPPFGPVAGHRALAHHRRTGDLVAPSHPIRPLPELDRKANSGHSNARPPPRQAARVLWVVVGPVGNGLEPHTGRVLEPRHHLRAVVDERLDQLVDQHPVRQAVEVGQRLLTTVCGADPRHVRMVRDPERPSGPRRGAANPERRARTGRRWPPRPPPAPPRPIPAAPVPNTITS